ncbi:MAG: MBL fold metallo-hydrolase [Candidatus Bathyarchaeia archaeon]
MLKITSLLNKATLSTSILVNWEGFLFLLDIGSSKVKAILITHSHIDHFWDIVPFLWLRRLWNQKNPIKIICPKPYMDLFLWYIEVARAKEFASIQVVDENSKIEINNLMIKPFKVEHSEEIALGYAITELPKTKLLIEKLKDEKIPIEMWRKIATGEELCFNGEIIKPEKFFYKKQRKIVYSGDTRPCDSLKKAAENADLLIIEASNIGNKFQNFASKKEHISIEDALKIALESKAKRILFTYIPLNYSLNEVFSRN